MEKSKAEYSDGKIKNTLNGFSRNYVIERRGRGTRRQRGVG